MRTTNRQSKTEWHRIVVFNRLAEVLGNILKKGDHVLVEGSLSAPGTSANPMKKRKPGRVKRTSLPRGRNHDGLEHSRDDRPQAQSQRADAEVAPAAAASGDLTGADDPAF